MTPYSWSVRQCLEKNPLDSLASFMQELQEECINHMTIKKQVYDLLVLMLKWISALKNLVHLFIHQTSYMSLNFCKQKHFLVILKCFLLHMRCTEWDTVTPTLFIFLHIWLLWFYVCDGHCIWGLLQIKASSSNGWWKNSHIFYSVASVVWLGSRWNMYNNRWPS